ncbi:hypothetical protein Tco_1205591, partial [Tanacetum coccineum]
KDKKDKKKKNQSKTDKKRKRQDKSEETAKDQSRINPTQQERKTKTQNEVKGLKVTSSQSLKGLFGVLKLKGLKLQNEESVL